MSEIYRGSSNTVYLNIDGAEADVPPTAIAYHLNDPETIYELDVTGPEVEGDVQTWAAVISFAHTQECGTLVVHWEFVVDDNEGTKDDYFDIVVPLADLGTIRDELELIEANVDDWTLIRAERRVRRIIENTTGQVFAPVTKTNILTTTASKTIRMPERLINLTDYTVNGVVATPDIVDIELDGWIVRKSKTYYVGSYIKSGAVIRDPYSQLNSYWRGGGEVILAGRWGWERVPHGVFEAALVLLEQILCPETAYRDRYLKTMTAADFRFEFAPGAYVGTGNVVADHLLRDYRVPNLAAVL